MLCVYGENVSIRSSKSFITIQGACPYKTKLYIQWGDTAQTPNPRAILGTYLWFYNICTHILIHTFQHIFLLVKIHMGPTKSCRFHINLVSLMWILTNQRERLEKCVKIWVPRISRAVVSFTKSKTQLLHYILFSQKT